MAVTDVLLAVEAVMRGKHFVSHALAQPQT